MNKFRIGEKGWGQKTNEIYKYIEIEEGNGKGKERIAPEP